MLSQRAIIRIGLSIAILILCSVLLMRLVDESKLITTFPLDYINDLTAYIGQLYFLKVCGFLDFCPYWYEGFHNLAISPPGWYFFAYPFLLVLGSPIAAAYVSLVLLFALGFGASLFLAKHTKLPKIFGVAFFAFVFCNAINIGNFIRLGRMHALFVLVLGTLFFALVYPYRKRGIDASFFWISVVFAAMIVTHYQETVLFSFLFLGLFLTRSDWKEKGFVILAGVGAILLASWWFIPFVMELPKSSLLVAEMFLEGKRTLVFNENWGLTNLIGLVMPLVMGILFFFFWKGSNDKRRELLFFSPVLVLAFLRVTYLHTLLPILRNIGPDPYIVFFLFFAVFFLLKLLAVEAFSKKIVYLILVGLIVWASMSAGVSLFRTPWFPSHTVLDEEVMGLFALVEGKYLIFIPEDRSFNMPYSRALYSYAVIYHNLSTADGWSQPLASGPYLKHLTSFKRNYLNYSCTDFRDELVFFKTKDVITYIESCDYMRKCGLEFVAETPSGACLYRVTE